MILAFSAIFLAAFAQNVRSAHYSCRRGKPAESVQSVLSRGEGTNGALGSKVQLDIRFRPT